jgi:hypothetical protein
MNIPSKIFIQKLQEFEHTFESDPRWDIIFSNGGRKWYYLVVTCYNGNYFLSEVLQDASEIQINADGEIPKESLSDFEYEDKKFWKNTLSQALIYFENVKNDWVGVYQRLMQKYPYIYRQGRIHSNIVRHFCKNIRRIDEEFGEKNLQKFISMVEKREIDLFNAGNVENLTAARYFEYCKVAYLNSHLKMDKATENLSGIELYKRFADGRHEGLTEITQDSVEEFRDWMDEKHPKKDSGGHPWEILRGGNTTNITLYVSKSQYKKGNFYEIRLYGDAISRIAETLKIYLSLVENNMSVAIDNPNKIRNRLLGQDSIGIVPEYESLHRSENLFDEDISDTAHLTNFENAQKEIIKLASWEQLPCLKPI